MQRPLTSVYFFIPPEVHLLDISGPAHIFYEAKSYGAPLETFYLSLNDAFEMSSAGMQLGNLIPFNETKPKPEDLIFVPGLESTFLHDSNFIERCQPFFDWLTQQHQRGVKVCSVCTGAYLLGHANLLDNTACTTHWKYLKDFHKSFPKAELLTDRLFVKSGRVYTSAGVSSGIDLALFMLEEMYGGLFATKIAKEVVVYLRRTEEDPQLSVFLQYRNHIDQRIHSAQDFLVQHVEKKVTIDQIAESTNMSPRNLTRLFKKTIGITIGEYQDKLRVEKAVQLLADGNKVDVVSNLCGLKSANQLRSLLKKYKSALPHELQSI